MRIRKQGGNALEYILLILSKGAITKAVELLKARKEALSELEDCLTDDEYEVAMRAIDKYIDILEKYGYA